MRHANSNIKVQNLINHIAIVLDGSLSMRKHAHKVVDVFDSEISRLKNRSVQMNQETRLSVYFFGDRIDCLVFDMDVMRMPSIQSHYSAEMQSTRLVDATAAAVRDMKQLPELYGDHAFLTYVLTDGEENASGIRASELKSELDRLSENWTLACMVPDSRGLHEAKKVGFPGDSVQVWDTQSVFGIEEVGKTFQSAMDNYMILRSTGVRGTSSFFADAKNISRSTAKTNLVQLSHSTYVIKASTGTCEIRDIAVSGRYPYNIGNGYYELIKPEEVQASKRVIIRNRKTGEAFADARHMVGIPDGNVKIRPGDHGEWEIFVQSTSVNRKILPGQKVLVIR